MNDVLKEIENYKIVPVVTLQSEDEFENVLGALVEGGLPLAEICFRTEAAEKALRFAAERFPEMIAGAGTVIEASQCLRALDAGAKFIVSPGFSDEVFAVCKEKKVPYFPGIATPTELMHALSLGVSDVKFFPASCFGGLKTIRALSAAFPQVRFMPTGGVSLDNLKEYLTFPKIFACGGSWMTTGTHSEMIEKTKAAVCAAKEVQK